MIPVTKSFKPPINEYNFHLLRAYENEWFTNRGELVLELEEKISNYLNLKDTQLLCLNNGTTPIQIALKLFGNGGEIITTPFSYVATTSTIVWEGCTPVFVDIHPEYLTIDETKIEKAITSKTTCILATHVFGNPCNVTEIERIAKKHRLKVIYDAAHAFGVTFNDKSIFEYGDISTCSFHATKLFHTGEGGAIFCRDNQLFDKIYYSHNFGHKGPNDFIQVGINGKMSEIHAAMGLAILPYANSIIKKRNLITERYNKNLQKEYLQFKIRNGTTWNSSYFPIIFKSEANLIKCMEKLQKYEILPRRYFYPSLNTLNYVDYKEMNRSEDIAQRILCLPLYPELKKSVVNQIIKIVNS